MTHDPSCEASSRWRSTSRSLVLIALSLWCMAGQSREASEEPKRAPNRLIAESSPYLRLHANNPVDWYPWGTEALEKSGLEGKPIFLSIGYTACYWCHVMEREVFSDPQIGELMNRWFVNIKVDREERPDLDEIYMTATQIITGSGGWPNSVFLTPELEPFYAGTYFPPEDREGRPGFVTVLNTVQRAWSESRDEVEARARKVAALVKTSMSLRPADSSTVSLDAALEVVAAVKNQFDSDFGGFGGAPKFPHASNLILLWDRAEHGDGEAERIVVETLSAMGRGAIFDHLEGGFHRYTLDREWRKPHFEKMLYDNALLAELLVVVAADQGDPFLERLASTTLDFLLQTMRATNGAFLAAIDAETDGVEGAFYLWSRNQIEAAIEGRDLELFAPIYGLDREPNFDDRHYTLYLTDSYQRHAARLEMKVPQLVARIQPVLTRLATERKRRPFPIIDDKVLCDWNGMAISALARAGQRLGRADYLDAAVKTASFLLALRDDEGTQLHVWWQGSAKNPAYLDDYAFLIRGLLTLYEVTNEARWLVEAQRLTEEADFRLTAPGGAYFAAGSDPHLLVRAATAWDESIPAANGVMVTNLLRLAEWTGREAFRLRARRVLSAFSDDLQRVPTATATLALGTLRFAESSAGVSGSLAGEARDVVQVSITAQAADEAGWQEFTLTLAIRDGWHVNANPASLEFLVPTEVTGPVRGLRYPPGSSIEVAFADSDLLAFESEAVIRGESEVGEPIRLRYQACDERRCLPPVSLVLEPTAGAP